ncbi:hypothetical protein I5N59_13020 [Serratia marcescens]|uniref:hypothetical protein n=1 Tax=Serratia marcescens TaxID=615 RepID=UPI0018DA0D47|nr:hypothetical protein [Serratia marcescens]
MNNPLASLSLAWMLSGCTSPYPISVEKPRPAPWSVAAEKKPKIDNIKKIALVYRELWRGKYISLYRKTYGYNEVGFLGTLVAVISAASGSVTTAMYSGGIAVGDNIFSGHYNYAAQIYNYKTAAASANYMYEVINLLDQGVVLIIDNNKAYYTDVGNYLYQNLGDLAYELEIRLAGVELITPNLDALAEAIKKEQQNKARLLGVTTSQGYKFYSKEDKELAVASVTLKIKICRINMTDKPS